MQNGAMNRSRPRTQRATGDGVHVEAAECAKHLARGYEPPGRIWEGSPRSLRALLFGWAPPSLWAPRCSTAIPSRRPPSVSERREAYHCRAGEDPVGRARARLTKSAFSASVIASRKDSASDFDGQR